MTTLLACLLTLNPSFTNVDVAKLSVEEKVGQTLLVQFKGQEVNEEAKRVICDLHVGGIIYYNWANGLTSPKQVLSLSSGLQNLAKTNHHPLPLFIAVDQETGVVARLSNGFTIFPGMRALGQVDDLLLTEKVGEAIAEEIKAVGVNYNLAPIVDIATNSRSYIGVRSFGNTQEKVRSHAYHLLQGFKKHALVSCLKHFPGHGDVTIDSHDDVPFVYKTKEELHSNELAPFIALKDVAPSIMTAHIKIPALDDKIATLSPCILEGLLRHEIGYNGLIISDSLVMGGVIKSSSSIEDAAVDAFKAGCDVLIFGGKLLNESKEERELTVEDIERVFKHLVTAVKKGEISEARLNRSVQRILDTKKQYGLFENINPREEELHLRIATKAHKSLAEEVAKRALKITNPHLLKRWQTENKKTLVIASELLKDRILACYDGNTFFFKESDFTEDTIKNLQAQLLSHDRAIWFSHNSWKNEKLQTTLKAALGTIKNRAWICVRDEEDTKNLDDHESLIILTYSPTQVSIQCALDLLK